MDGESPNKRQKTFATQDNFVSLNDESGAASHINSERRNLETPPAGHFRPRHHDPRNQRDRPKSKHELPGCEPWLLIKTRLGRRFVHNPFTKESLWRIPSDVLPAVQAFEQDERAQKEKAENAAWAEQQLQQMRPQKQLAEDLEKAAPNSASERRRRSVSLQREDEAALMAELAAQADADAGPSSALPTTSSGPHVTYGYDSDGSYEELEVTDSEGEGDDETGSARATGADARKEQTADQDEAPPDVPVEFGEDDIAYQLAAMGEDYGLDAGKYGDEPEDGWEDGAQGLGVSEEDAANLFRDLLDDYRISPYTPWDKVIADESENSILNDDRYTILSSMKARREVFDAWARDKAAQIKAERAAMHKLSPRVPYLAFLQDKASPKLYWPEFKRKYKREAEMNDRKLSDKDREKLYRDHIARLKLPESTRRGDLESLLKGLPLSSLNSQTTLESLPEQLLSHLHYISLQPKVRDPIIMTYVRSLPDAPEDFGRTEEERMVADKKRDERRRREQALADREAKVREERQRQEKIERSARRELRDGERELERAMGRGARPAYS